jgi:hypothetical protein
MSYIVLSSNLIRRIRDGKNIKVNFSDPDFIEYFHSLSEHEQNKFKETAFKVEWDIIRTKRNQLISNCDWTQLPDNTLSDEQRTAWKQYRQTLRDITNTEDPFSVIWPKQPGEL